LSVSIISMGMGRCRVRMFSLSLFFFIWREMRTVGRSVALAVKRWPFMTEARVQFRAISWEIRSAPGAGFLVSSVIVFFT
jgi:hypothetical protein